MKNYDHKKIEKKWQKEWDNKKIYNALDPQKAKSKKQKPFYGLIEFPYPSGAGLHVGHIRSNTAMDIIARKRRMEGYNVLYPMGWDAFGLPTENYAIKTGIQPAKVTKQNTDMFRKQLKALGFSFDWSREVNTTDPEYYKWTQWIFLQMYKKGLAYKAKTTINWCPKDKIGLANEEVVGGLCERCDTPVVKKEKEQWMLAITKYADRLDKDLDDVNYLEKIKIQQRNWIGKSEGSEIDFKIKNTDQKIKVFTTRADTLFGAFAVILAPEHSMVQNLKSQISNWNEVEKYLKDTKKKTDIERTAEEKDKTGVELKGVKAINPVNNEEIPVWIADFVLVQYGTGAVFADMHDERDFAFAKKYKLPMRRVLEEKFVCSEGDGKVRPGLPFVHRNAVCAIVRNPKDGKYLCVSWKKFLMHGLITGGVEDGEDFAKAALREIHEETGYKNVKLVKDPSVAIHSLFYHRVKEQNRHARFQYMFFELIDEAQDPIDKKESDLHDVLWKTKDELKSFLSVVEGTFVLNLIAHPDYIYTGEGILSNSGIYNGMESQVARKKITEAVGGKMVIKFKLRDWIFSRQRYWGEPIPIIHCDKCGEVPVPEKDLPITLPKVKSYMPTDNGESPLAIINKWVNTKCPKCKGKAKRETDTMPNWAGSSWYFLRYIDPKNSKNIFDPKKLMYWCNSKQIANSKQQVAGPVDWYNGGMEHTTLHLLYSRFWHKFLYDIKMVPTKEPYMKRTSHGMILAEGGVKMSKSLNNTVDPQDIVDNYGADTLRLYEMFMGPFDQAVAWSTESLIGPRRFLDKVWKISQRKFITASDVQLIKILHQTIKKVSEDIESMNFNTSVSAMMMLVNEMEKTENISTEDFKMFLQILAPFAPHITEELYQDLQAKSKKQKAKSIHLSAWPKYDPKKIVEDRIKIAVQVNGKVRVELSIDAKMREEEIKAEALKDKAIIPWIEGKEVKRIIYVTGRLINIVV